MNKCVHWPSGWTKAHCHYCSSGHILLWNAVINDCLIDLFAFTIHYTISAHLLPMFKNIPFFTALPRHSSVTLLHLSGLRNNSAILATLKNFDWHWHKSTSHLLHLPYSWEVCKLPINWCEVDDWCRWLCSANCTNVCRHRQVAFIKQDHVDERFTGCSK